MENKYPLSYGHEREKGVFPCPAMRRRSNRVAPAAKRLEIERQPPQCTGLGVGAVGELLLKDLSSPPSKNIRKRSR